MIGGQTDIMFTDLGTVLPFIKAGKLRLWAVGSKDRHAQFPEVPTVAESGYGGFDWYSWTGILARKGTPPEALERLSKAVAAALNVREFKQDQLDRGYMTWGSTPQELDELLARNAAATKALVEKRNLKFQ